MKVVVTGCAGFIGINFTDFLLREHPEDKIIGIDALTYAANFAALCEVTRGCENFAFYKANICDRAEIYKIFEAERPDVVVNFAAESHVDRSIIDSAPFIETNVVGTGVLLDAALKFGVLRFHQISTDEVYGDLPIDSDKLFTEKSPLLPSSPYSASKAAADMLALSYARTHGLPISITRSSNNYGAYQHAEKLIPSVILRAQGNEKIAVYGTGENVRDWIHVSDNCRAIDAVLRLGEAGEIYNVGGGNLFSNLRVIGYILDGLGKSRELIEFTSDRPGHDRKYALDSSKIKALGWAPKVDFREGLTALLRISKD